MSAARLSPSGPHRHHSETPEGEGPTIQREPGRETPRSAVPNTLRQASPHVKCRRVLPGGSREHNDVAGRGEAPRLKFARELRHDIPPPRGRGEPQGPLERVGVFCTFRVNG